MRHDRPADEEEIEVTPEMIEAGLDRMYDLPEPLVSGDIRSALAAAYRAMRTEETSKPH